MSSGTRINFDEQIPEMIKRLELEHKNFESKLTEVETNVDTNNIIGAAEIIRSISDKIIRHAVEEEARLMRVIMHKAKEESTESIKIMQEHNWVMNFLKNRMIIIKKTSTSSNPDEREQAKNDLNEFISNLRNHFKEEEEIVFPLALRADSAD
jgi:hemerythrin-like domain-containing protein